MWECAGHAICCLGKPGKSSVRVRDWRAVSKKSSGSDGADGWNISREKARWIVTTYAHCTHLFTSSNCWSHACTDAWDGCAVCNQTKCACNKRVCVHMHRVGKTGWLKVVVSGGSESKKETVCDWNGKATSMGKEDECHWKHQGRMVTTLLHCQGFK